MTQMEHDKKAANVPNVPGHARALFAAILVRIGRLRAAPSPG
jgi:hypothetical protein